jgi:serine/threonine protein kinase
LAGFFVAHCDIKPSNILFDPRISRAQVIDFDLCMRTKNPFFEYRTLSKATIYGTVPYVAPEILSGDGVSPLVDIWSFGLVLIGLLYPLKQLFSSFHRGEDDEEKQRESLLNDAKLIPEKSVLYCFFFLVLLLYSYNYSLTFSIYFLTFLSSIL